MNQEYENQNSKVPLKDQQKFDFEIETDYYNEKIHRSAFDLPEFMKKRIKEEIDK